MNGRSVLMVAGTGTLSGNTGLQIAHLIGKEAALGEAFTLGIDEDLTWCADLTCQTATPATKRWTGTGTSSQGTERISCE